MQDLFEIYIGAGHLFGSCLFRALYPGQCVLHMINCVLVGSGNVAGRVHGQQIGEHLLSCRNIWNNDQKNSEFVNRNWCWFGTRLTEYQIFHVSRVNVDRTH